MWQPPLCILSEKPWVFQNGKGTGMLHELRRPGRQLAAKARLQAAYNSCTKAPRRR